MCIYEMYIFGINWIEISWFKSS